MPDTRSPKKIIDLLTMKTVVTLAAIQKALAGASVMTVFRYLKKVPYRRSYNHNGKYYALHNRSRYDRFGLWSFKGIHFSVDGSLVKTVRRLVYESPAGAFHNELHAQLQTRVHNPLLQLNHKAEISRVELDGHYLYLHIDPKVQVAQLEKRRQWIAEQTVQAELTDTLVIEVLLILIRHPGTKPADVVRRLRGHSPPINVQHVRMVFDRYDLANVGEKGGPSIC